MQGEGTCFFKLFFIKAEDVKLIHSISENTSDYIVRFEPKDNGLFNNEECELNVNIAIDISEGYKYLSNTKNIYFIDITNNTSFLKFVKKFFEFNFFENLWDYEIHSKSTQQSTPISIITTSIIYCTVY
jgi:hypothetical protein